MNDGVLPRKEKGKNRFLHINGLILILLSSIVIGLLFGSAKISLSTILQVLQQKLFGVKEVEVSASAVYIIWEMRIPRAIMAIAVGGGLAISGTAMQALTQNVLAEPYILGVSSGASAMVSMCYFFGGASVGMIGTHIFAFLGAILALILVYRIGMTGDRGSNTRIVLAGMSVSIILNAVSQFFISMSSAMATRNITLWMMGSIAEARWNNIAIPLIGALLGLIFFQLMARAFNLFSLGDETAICLGVNIRVVKKITIIVVAFITGLAVAAGGIIGLVGFIVPHISRAIVGSDHRKLFPFTFLSGGIFLLFMDVLARTVMAPQEVPIGIFTALCGGPIFIWILYKQTRKR